MRELVWRIRYTVKWKFMLKSTFKEGWYMSRVAVNEGEYYEAGYSPEEAINDELSYWS